ncbi:hypothetical protein [Flavobacterium sp.]|uniref:hypothetical protein n=1 Tax=Flavobacterium sp. TaxID=239 RepID=UPI0032642068
MKKLLIAIVLFITTISLAQTPIIKQFREVVKDAPNQFTNFQKDLLSDNPEKHNKLYNSTIDDTAISKNVISKTEGKNAVYIIRFDVANLQGMMLKMFTLISGQYITEMNEMLKSGAYKGRDYQENGESITELKDLKGNLAVEYISNEKEHSVMVYGAPVK